MAKQKKGTPNKKSSNSTTQATEVGKLAQNGTEKKGSPKAQVQPQKSNVNVAAKNKEHQQRKARPTSGSSGSSVKIWLALSLVGLSVAIIAVAFREQVQECAEHTYSTYIQPQVHILQQIINSDSGSPAVNDAGIDLASAHAKRDVRGGEDGQNGKEDAINKANAERQAKEDAINKANAEKQAKEDAINKANAERQAKEDAINKANAERQAKEDAINKANAEKQAKEDAINKANAERQAKEDAINKANAERQAKEDAINKANAERQAKEDAINKANAERQAKEDAINKANADRQAKEDAINKANAERQAKEDAINKANAERQAKEDAINKANAERQAKEDAINKANAERQAKEDAINKANAERQAKEDAINKANADRQAKEDAINKANAEKQAKEDAINKANAERQAKEDAINKANAERQAKEDAVNKANAERQAKEDAINKANAERQAKEDAVNKANAERQAKEDAINKANAERQAKEDAINKANAERQAKEDAINKANAEREKQAKEDAINKANAERQAKEDAVNKANAERQAKEDAINKANAERQAKEDAINKANAERQAKEDAINKANAEREKQAKEDAINKANAEKQAKEDAINKANAERQAKEDAINKANAERQAKEDAINKANAEKQAKEDAINKANAERQAKQDITISTNAGNKQAQNAEPHDTRANTGTDKERTDGNSPNLESANEPKKSGGSVLQPTEPDLSSNERASITSEEDFQVFQDLDEADELLETDELEKALVKYDQILLQYPSSPRALYGKGLTLDKLGFKYMSNEKLEQAIEFLALVLQLPNVPEELQKLTGRKLADRQQFRGWGVEAVKTFKTLVQRFPEDVALINELGVSYLMIGRNDRARDVFKEVLVKDSNNGFAKAHLGFILKTQDNDLERAVELLTEGIKSGAPGTVDGRFFLHLGDSLLRLGRESEARALFQEGAEKQLFLSAWQRSLYNVERLTGRPWWTPEQTTYQEYLKLLQDNWKVIRDEGLTQLNAKAGSFMPEDENLRDTGDWKQFTLYQQGRKKTENCAKAPETCRLIDMIPDARGCKRGQVKFSVMSPGIHVWPHVGPTNCRIRTHLGLVVPEGPVIRVMNETRTWKEGEFIIFDDSFEHEVWHEGSELRLVLIIDFWHPELTEAEKRRLSAI